MSQSPPHGCRTWVHGKVSRLQNSDCDYELNKRAPSFSLSSLGGEGWAEEAFFFRCGGSRKARSTDDSLDCADERFMEREAMISLPAPTKVQMRSAEAG